MLSDAISAGQRPVVVRGLMRHIGRYWTVRAHLGPTRQLADDMSGLPTWCEHSGDEPRLMSELPPVLTHPDTPR